MACLLEDSAAQAQRRGGAAAAARALERAAELSPGERDKARRLLAAADLALSAGQADWVRELAGTGAHADIRPGPAHRRPAGYRLVAAVVEPARRRARHAHLRRRRGIPEAAGHRVERHRDAATVAHQTGLPEACAKARAALDALDALGEPVPSADWPASRADENRIWITACTDPFGRRSETVPYLHRIAGGSLFDRGKVGGAAWILDETELAVRVLREALSRLRAPGVRGASGAVLSVLEWACIDSGRWDDALAAAREANDIAAAYKMETVAGSADLATATVLAMRGDHDQVAPLLARVLAAVDAAEYRGFAARIRHTAGLAALAQGNYVTAYAQLSQLFAADGTPLHHHFSYLAVADLAAAAARAERRLEAGRWWSGRWPAWTPRPGRGWNNSRPALADCSPSPTAPSRISPRPWPIPPETRGRSNGPSFSWTTGNGCGGSDGSTTPSPSSRRPWRRSAVWARRRGPGARNPNCVPAA